MMTIRTIRAADLHIGDIVVPEHGPARRVTLHRLQGAPPTAVIIGYADAARQQIVPADQKLSVAIDRA